MSAYDTGGADSTTDLQAAFDAAAAIIAVSGRCQLILDSRKLYVVGGAVTAGTNGEWSQLHLPFSAAAGWFEIQGIPGGHDLMSSPSLGTVIQSTLTTAPSFVSTRGIASCIGTTAAFQYGNATPTRNRLAFAVKNVTILEQKNPPIAGLDLGWSNGCDIDGLFVTSNNNWLVDNVTTANITQPTSPQAVGVVFPFYDPWTICRAGTVAVAGFYAAYSIGEWLNADFVYHQWCWIGLALDSSHYANRIGFLASTQTPYGIAALDPASGVVKPLLPPKGSHVNSGFVSPLVVAYWVIQSLNNAPAWANYVLDVSDADSLISATFAAVDLFPARSLAMDGGFRVSAPYLHQEPRVLSLATLDLSIAGTPAGTVAGTFAMTTGTAYHRGALGYNSTGTQNDGFYWTGVISPGYWWPQFEYYSGPAYGILTLDYSVDGGTNYTSLGTIDCYAPTYKTPAGQQLATILNPGPNSVTVRFRIRVLTKNAAASGYTGAWSSCVLTQAT
jgi:hypothetical protein